MPLTLLPTPMSTTPRRRAGRPRVTEVAAEREKHIAVAKARLLYRARVKELARYHGVDAWTIWRWTKLALAYDCPESDRLRRLARSRSSDLN